MVKFKMALPSHGKICLASFLLGVTSFLISKIVYLDESLFSVWNVLWIILYLLYVGLINVAVWFIYNTKDAYKNAVRACFLGCVCGLGLIISCESSTWAHFGWYLTSLSIFHWSEFFITAVTNPKSLTVESYLLDHSKEYKIAAVASWVEFTVEMLLFPGVKQLRVISIVGLILVIIGDVTRKASMITASTNFNHYVQYRKQHDHRLVTHGVYSFCRHPSYVGWFLWSIGTQVMLFNPVCLVGYTVASWRFFRERIYEEEIYLISFFGEEYINYKKHVGSGLPFIRGYEGPESD